MPVEAEITTKAVDGGDYVAYVKIAGELVCVGRDRTEAGAIVSAKKHAPKDVTWKGEVVALPVPTPVVVEQTVAIDSFGATPEPASAEPEPVEVEVKEEPEIRAQIPLLGSEPEPVPEAVLLETPAEAPLETPKPRSKKKKG